MDRRGPAPARRWAAWLAQWAALAALYYLAIHLALRGRAGPPRDWIFALAGSGDWLAALLGAASFRLAAGAFAAASREAEDRRALSSCLAGAPPQDGKRYAAAGRIAPLAAPLAAPLSGTACVAYCYRIGGGDDVRKPVIVRAELVSARVRPMRRAGEAPLAFAGLALAPAVVATGGPAGEV